MFTPQAFSEAWLPEHDGHQVFYAQYGNQDGPAIMVCHGGPGGSSKAKHAGVFDLTQYRVVCIDQRGCGRSVPVGETANNTTVDLVSDMERVREQLGIETWFVSGGSWGAALALVYAETYPDRVRGLLLSAIFLADAASNAWAFQGDDGVARLFADGWEQLQAGLKELGVAATDDMPAALLRLMLDGDVTTQQAVAALVASWEVNLLSRTIPIQYKRPEEMVESDIAATKIFLHYQANKYWLETDQILQHVACITAVPAVIVHGRYDILCPFSVAWRLHQAMPRSTCVALPESHHVIAGDGAVAREYVFKHFLDEQEYQR